jgi:hypothetical protein
MCLGKSFRKLLSVPPAGVQHIQVVPNFVHQDISDVEPMQPIQIGPSKGVGVKKPETD